MKEPRLIINGYDEGGPTHQENIIIGPVNIADGMMARVYDFVVMGDSECWFWLSTSGSVHHDDHFASMYLAAPGMLAHWSERPIVVAGPAKIFCKYKSSGGTLFTARWTGELVEEGK